MSKFMDGCAARGVNDKKARKIWDHMEQFAGYGFNKSHSAAYALLAYQTAYLKAHYPVCFMSALLTSEISSTDKIVKYINECRDMGIKILAPDVNLSQLYFTPAGADIRFGLLAIKNVGENAIRSILDARQKHGTFKSIFDFCEQVDLRVVNKRVIESLIKGGALDSLGYRRSQLFAVVDKAIEGAQKAQRDRDSGQKGLFGMAPTVLCDPHPGYSSHELPNTPEWDEALLLSYEKETLGFYITGHPLAKYAADLSRYSASTTESLAELESGAEVSLGGILTLMKPLKTKKGDRMAVIQLEDLTGSVEAVIFPDPFQRFEKLLKPDAPLLVKGVLDVEDSGIRKIRVSEIQSIEGLRERMAKSVIVHINLERVTQDMAERLHRVLDGHPGEASVIFELEHPKAYLVTLRPNQFLRVKPSAQLVQELEGLCGAGAVKF
jgi:DNA polymerase III subunit alpha